MEDEISNTPEQSSEVVQAEHQTDAATSATESETATDTAEQERRDTERREKARENAAFAALRQREREAREEAARERAERQALTQRLMQGQTQTANEQPGAPNPEKYAGGEFNPEYVRDLARWEARQAYRDEMESMRKQHAEETAKQARQKAVETWQASQAAAQKKYDDFEIVVEASADKIPQQARMLMAGLKDGAELLYHASKDTALADKLTGTPVEIAAALGELRAEARYAAKLAAEKAAAETEAERPIRAGNAGGRGNAEPDPADTERYIAWRKKQLRAEGYRY